MQLNSNICFVHEIDSLSLSDIGTHTEKDGKRDDGRCCCGRRCSSCVGRIGWLGIGACFEKVGFIPFIHNHQFSMLTLSCDIINICSVLSDLLFHFFFVQTIRLKFVFLARLIRSHETRFTYIIPSL